MNRYKIILIAVIGIFNLILHWLSLIPLSESFIPNYSILLTFFSIIFLTYFSLKFFRIENKVQPNISNDITQADVYKLRMAPHFLFNCLMTLRALNDSDKEKFDEYIQSLAQLLRYAYQHAESDFVEIEKEIEFAKLYFELVKDKTEFPGILQIDNSLPDDLIGLVQMPPFSLQTLIENSFKYAVLRSKSQIVIMLKIFYDKSENIVRIIVQDNGPGTDSENISETDTFRFIRKKLQSIYPMATIQQSSRKDHQFKTLIKIPLGEFEDEKIFSSNR